MLLLLLLWLLLIVVVVVVVVVAAGALVVDDITIPIDTHICCNNCSSNFNKLQFGRSTTTAATHKNDNIRLVAKICKFASGQWVIMSLPYIRHDQRMLQVEDVCDHFVKRSHHNSDCYSERAANPARFLAVLVIVVLVVVGGGVFSCSLQSLLLIVVFVCYCC